MECRQRVAYHDHLLKACHGTDRVAHAFDQLCGNLGLILLGGKLGALLEHHDCERDLALERVVLFCPACVSLPIRQQQAIHVSRTYHADHGALGDTRMLRYNLLDGARGNAMTSDVDYVVGTRKHVKVVVVVLVASVASLIEARMLGKVLLEAGLVFVQAHEAIDRPESR